MKRLWIFKLFTLFVLVSCGQSYNTNYNDATTYGNSGITPGTSLYNAYNVLQSKCFSCHGKEWGSYTTTQAWIDAGLVVSGSKTNSIIYSRLKNNGGDMPPAPYSSLTQEELNYLSTWIGP